MNLITIDVGKGTQDILLPDENRTIENCIKMVLPSQTQIIANHINQATVAGQNILLTGTIMGGGPSGKAVHKHIQAGLKVYATIKSALTLHDNLEKVVLMGVNLIDEQESSWIDAKQIILNDVDINALGKALGLFDIEMPKNFAVAVQDHGNAPDISNRIFRFQHFKKVLEEGGELELFAYLNQIPDHLTRMLSVMQTLKTDNNYVLVMDTGPAAICGALVDAPESPVVVVNIGNGHTLAAVVLNHKILALFEHHTRQIDVAKLDDYIIRLCDGNLSFDEVFNDGGHGCHIQEAVGFKNIQSVIVTGPNRHIIQGSKIGVQFAAPHGDIMLTGCFGLMEMFRKKILAQENSRYRSN